MNFDEVVRQIRYLRRLLGEADRNEDGFIVLDADNEADIRESLGHMEETLTGRPSN